MDDTTRLIIAYGLVLAGAPLLTAKLLWLFPGAVAGLILDRISRGLRGPADELAEGFLSLLTAALIFRYLELPVGSALPGLLIVLQLLWSGFIRQAPLSALPAAAGIVAGFFLHPRVVPLLTAHLPPLA